MLLIANSSVLIFSTKENPAKWPGFWAVIEMGEGLGAISISYRHLVGWSAWEWVGRWGGIPALAANALGAWQNANAGRMKSFDRIISK